MARMVIVPLKHENEFVVTDEVFFVLQMSFDVHSPVRCCVCRHPGGPACMFFFLNINIWLLSSLGIS